MQSTTEKKFYDKWSKIKMCCLNKKYKGYKHYGGKGIVCQWRDFKEFETDMYKSFVAHAKEYGLKDTTIDRIDNSKGYSKDNCRWSTRAEQRLNRTDSRLITVNGVTKNLIQWADQMGIKRNTMSNRINCRGMHPVLAVITPLLRKRKPYFKKLQTLKQKE